MQFLEKIVIFSIKKFLLLKSDHLNIVIEVVFAEEVKNG